MIKLDVRDEGDVTVITVSGHLALAGDGSRPLHDAAREQLARGRKNIVVDLSGVEGMDSLGIGDLIGAYTLVSRQGGGLKLLQPSKKIKLLMEMTALDHLFEVFSEEGEAMRSFLI
jgi:anti-sigma B factor antagonist